MILSLDRWMFHLLWCNCSDLTYNKVIAFTAIIFWCTEVTWTWALAYLYRNYLKLTSLGVWLKCSFSRGGSTYIHSCIPMCSNWIGIMMIIIAVRMSHMVQDTNNLPMQIVQPDKVTSWVASQGKESEKHWHDGSILNTKSGREKFILRYRARYEIFNNVQVWGSVGINANL